MMFSKKKKKSKIKQMLMLEQAEYDLQSLVTAVFRLQFDLHKESI